MISRSKDLVRRGLIEEVASVLADGHPPNAPGLDGIGIREAVDYLHGRGIAVQLNTFLDAGGSSLTAVQAISKLQQRLGVHVAVEEFIFQTGIQLAALCDQKMEARRLSESSEVAVGAGSFQMRGAGAGR